MQVARHILTLNPPAVSERVLSEDERPWRIVVRLAKESVRRMELARFYLQPKRDPHGPTLALFVASLPPGLSERNYENILVEFLGAGGCLLFFRVLLH